MSRDFGLKALSCLEYFRGHSLRPSLEMNLLATSQVKSSQKTLIIHHRAIQLN